MSKPISQKEAIYLITTRVLKENNIELDGRNISDVITKEMRAVITMALIEGIKEGSVSLGKQLPDDETRRLAQGTISNWFRKDLRLNGGGVYIPKNPGTKIGHGDKVLKNLRKLAKELQGTSHEGEVLKELYIRTNQIRKDKPSKVNPNLIPDSLKHLL